MRFDLIRPCPKCPFRTDVRPYLRQEGAYEISDALLAGRTFTCHETTVQDEDGDMQDGPNAQHCAGALIILEKLEQPNQMMRWMERIGFYDRRKLDMDAPVFEDFDEFTEVQGA